MRKLMADAIAQLAPEVRQVCLLRDVLQYRTPEVAQKLGISALAVRLRLFRAHRKLREKLSHVSQPPWQRQRTSASELRMPSRIEKRTRKERIPFVAIAQCACGD